jgi:hypothetical protein
MTRQKNALQNSENGGKISKPASFSPCLWVERYGYAHASAPNNGCKTHHTPFVGIIVVGMLTVILGDGVVKRQKSSPQLRALNSAAKGNEHMVKQLTLAEIKVKQKIISRIRMVESG